MDQLAEEKVITLRHLNWPADRAALLKLDTSFQTHRFYRVDKSERTFALVEVPTGVLISKTYPLAQQLDELPTFDWVQVAADGETICGLAAVRVEQWNQRAELHHLYVNPAARRRGVGRALVEAAADAAQRHGARCLWIETQTINVEAIRFYEQLGFVWCGLDTSLYNSADTAPLEVALFFARDLSEIGCG